MELRVWPVTEVPYALAVVTSFLKNSPCLSSIRDTQGMGEEGSGCSFSEAPGLGGWKAAAIHGQHPTILQSWGREASRGVRAHS